MINSYHTGYINTRKSVIYGFSKKKLPYKLAILTNKQKVLIPINKSIENSSLYVLIRIDKINKNDNGQDKIYGSIIKIYGNIDDLHAYNMLIVDSVLCKWNKHILYESHIDLTPNRRDFTNKNTISIDPLNCYDIDDAFDITKIINGYELNIHIADVSSFFEINSVFDNELFKRAASIYFDNQQIDMLPKQLLDQCSLLLNQKRRAFTLSIILDDALEILSYNFTKSHIINKYTLNYDNIDSNLNNNIYKDILLVKQFCQKYRYNNEKSLMKKELLKQDNVLISMPNIDSHEMIEILMIIINHYSISTISQFKNINIPIRHCKSTITSYELKKMSSINQKIQLYNQSAAKYDIVKSENIQKHDILNLDIYTHFSSPIRRYFDIYVHRILYNCINNIDINDYIIDTNYLNSVVSLYKKVVLEKKLLTILTDIQKLHNREVQGNIIGFKDNLLYIYFSDLDLIYYSKLFSKKITYIHIDQINNDIIVLDTHKNKSYKLKLGDKILVMFYIDLTEPKHKLICKNNIIE